MYTQFIRRSHCCAHRRVLLAVILACVALASLAGCGYSGSPSGGPAKTAIQGTVLGGSSPVINAKIQLYAVGTKGIGSSATSLSDSVTTDGNGAFVIPASYDCPSASAQLYVVARGGKPGPAATAENMSLVLAAMVGACDAPTTPIIVNEVSTIGSVWPVAAYIKSEAAIGSASGDNTFFAAAATIPQYVNLQQGTSPGTATPESYFAQNAKLYSLANLLDKCVNSIGGTAGDGTACGQLFAMATPAAGAPPVDTFAAAMDIAQNPYNQVAQIYSMSEPASTFAPALAAAPSDWTLQLSYPVAVPVISLATGTYTGAQTVAISDTMAGARIYYTTDGTTPSAASTVYTGPFSVSATSTVQAIAVSGISQSAVASSTVTIAVPAPTAESLAFAQQPSNATVGAVITPAIQVAVKDSNGNTLTTATNTVQLSLSGGNGLTGTLQAAVQNGFATFNNLAVSTAGTYTLTATSSGLGPAVSSSFTISAASTVAIPAKLVFQQQPTNAVAGASIAPAVTVAVEDAGGNVVTSAKNAVTITLAGGTGLAGTLTVSAVKGVATFSNLSVTPASSGDTMTAASSGLASAISSTFNITAAPVPTVTGKTYYLSSNGNDSNNGLTAATAWLTPNHTGLNCGDTILAAAGSYNAANFDMNHWGTVSCPSNNSVVWLKCASFAACTITDSSGHSGLRVDQSYWGVQGWNIGPLSGTGYEGQGSGIAFVASSCASIHHLIAADNIVHDAQTGGIVAYNSSWLGCAAPVSADYIAIIGNIVENAAQASSECYSGISIFQPVQTDSLPGTHIYIAGNFSFGNVDPNPCGGTSPTDGEGIILDTFDGSQAGFPTPYAGQTVVANNILVRNGGRGAEVFNNAAGSAHAAVFVTSNTMWGNNSDPNQKGPCGELLLYTAKNTTANNNALVATGSGGCGPQTAYAIDGANLDSSDQINQNAGDSPSGQNALVQNSPGFVLGNSMSAVNPGFAAPQAPPTPNCMGSANSVACMSSVIANFAITNATVSTLGYRTPGSGSIPDTLYPAWLCTTQMPAGIDTASCSGQ
jgi:hypothetical protein